MQNTVTSTGDVESYAMMLLLKQVEDGGRILRYFVCCECQDLVEVVQGWEYLHICEAGDFADSGEPYAAAYSPPETQVTVCV